MALAYLLCLTISLGVLAVALRHHPAPAPQPARPTPAPTAPRSTAEADIRAILTAAAQLAARLEPVT